MFTNHNIKQGIELFSILIVKVFVFNTVYILLVQPIIVPNHHDRYFNTYIKKFI